MLHRLVLCGIGSRIPQIRGFLNFNAKRPSRLPGHLQLCSAWFLKHHTHRINTRSGRIDRNNFTNSAVLHHLTFHGFLLSDILGRAEPKIASRPPTQTTFTRTATRSAEPTAHGR